MPTNRRDFLRRGLGSSALIASTASVPLFLSRSAALLASEDTAADRDRVLVVIELNGGNDGLNTVVPYADEDYRRARPTLARSPDRVRKIDERIGLHSALGGFEKLLERGLLSVVQGVGYPNPNRSHFGSMSVWQSGRLNAKQDDIGWLARVSDRSQAAVGADPAALHIRESASLPQALSGGDLAILSLTGPEQFRRRTAAAGTDDDPAQQRRRDQLAPPVGEARGTLVDFVARTTATTDAAHARFSQLLDSSETSRQAGLRGRMSLIAQMIKAGLATRIYYTELAGFDTHASQAGTHPGLLSELGDSVQAFISDLAAAGEAERVRVLVYSEFGRRLTENASGGTDHGTVQPVFLAGGALRHPFIGSPPDLRDLDPDGDPKHSIDFRRIYATLLNDWLDCPSALVLGHNVEPLSLL
ncbi:MAG TPA: DUF1501 domain-containing protein [Pirellulales bacterium]|nr:DUF1501 domain-containing protein [Pirellulales bacterium]